ncbi:hypothetical protein QBC46DRAFT_422905 [Diplogelasinospora grovesii]|uniref:Uncharacterized protein n=1 Tax=Diplogelasinospora grovesii TaxID=303347 RepID=A0AAN6MYY3_9PEZI|nr:hypothetical protein QBC46DRAFT_422905 [Diplogelasinospora grovesii]
MFHLPSHSRAFLVDRPRYGLQRLFLIVLGIWCALALGALDLSKNKEPQGPLGVRLDFKLATTWPADRTEGTGRAYLWSSYLTFRAAVSSITDGQLFQIAFDAHSEVRPDLEQYKIDPKHKPRAMGIMAFGNEIILASSQKGESFTYQLPDTPVYRTLQLCQDKEKTDKPHMTKGSCGEVMCAHLYYLSHPGTEIESQAPRFAAVTEKEGEPCLMKPCGGKDAWGCNLFTKAAGMGTRLSAPKPEPYDLTTIAGGLSSIDQILINGGGGGATEAD